MRSVSRAERAALPCLIETLFFHETAGTLFIEPQEMVYPGMVIGENSKIGDLEVNPVKAKETSNMR